MESSKIKTELRMNKRNHDVLWELVEMLRAGIHVNEKALKAAASNDLSKYDSMSVSELADLLRDLNR